MTADKITVLLVERDPGINELLTDIINGHLRLHVVSSVSSGEMALAYLAENRPDIVLMDTHLSGMNGFATTRKIMESTPLPIVICSGGIVPGDNSFNTLEAGAVAIVEKPSGRGASTTIEKLLDTLVLMSEIKVVRRWPQRRRSGSTIPHISVRAEAMSSCSIVAIGASTGGPPVLRTILQGLGQGKFPPIVIVQHISAGFLPGLISWLQKSAGLNCKVGVDNEPLVSGVVYFAPDHYQIGIDRSNRIILNDGPSLHNLKPSVSHLFQSVLQSCGGSAMGILLTGMGKDGAAELKQLRDAGGVTIAQKPESCVVSGMPGEAIRIGGATYILSPDEIASFLVSRLGRSLQQS